MAIVLVKSIKKPEALELDTWYENEFVDRKGKHLCDFSIYEVESKFSELVAFLHVASYLMPPTAVFFMELTENMFGLSINRKAAPFAPFLLLQNSHCDAIFKDQSSLRLFSDQLFSLKSSHRKIHKGQYKAVLGEFRNSEEWRKHTTESLIGKKWANL